MCWTGSTSSTTSILVKHYELTVTSSEMTSVEREAQAQNVDDIELDL